jgi:hypothetical protein
MASPGLTVGGSSGQQREEGFLARLSQAQYCDLHKVILFDGSCCSELRYEMSTSTVYVVYMNRDTVSNRCISNILITNPRLHTKTGSACQLMGKS